MATTSSDFVLDEGLDDDEDVLAFHSQRLRTGGGAYDAPTTHPDDGVPGDAEESASAAAHPSPPDTAPDAVIIDGMPPAASRADLDAFLHGHGRAITALQLRRLSSPAQLRARVRFSSGAAAAAALALDGADFAPGHPVSVKPASAERWAADVGAQRRVTERAEPVERAAEPAPLPAAAAAGSNSFWAALGAARAAAEALEVRAKKLGEELEGRLQVSEKVRETQAAVARADRELKVSESAANAAAAGKKAVGEFDEAYGVSKGVGKVVDDVGSAARIVAREVDENLRISEKAREATNAALRHDGIGPAVRTVVDRVGGTPEKGVGPGAETPRRRKNYQPSGIEQNKGDEGVREAEAPMPEVGE